MIVSGQHSSTCLQFPGKEMTKVTLNDVNDCRFFYTNLYQSKYFKLYGLRYRIIGMCVHHRYDSRSQTD